MSRFVLEYEIKSIRKPSSPGQAPFLDREFHDSEQQLIQVGRSAWLCLLEVRPDQPLPADQLLGYDIGLRQAEGAGDSWQWLENTAPHLRYPGSPSPSFVLKNRINRLYHGSCRRPHSPCEDGLVRLDQELARQTAPRS
ncbi:hypothetical protein [Marinobacter sp.]|uniref:hypothetical protein n=1 Tax=Marinobacter sp. TaxID=50741 RepID=UPI00384F807C